MVGGGVEGEFMEVREEVEEVLRLWVWAEGLTYVSEDLSKAKPRSSRARTTVDLAREGTRM